MEIKAESTKDWVPNGKHRKDQSWRRMCWSRTINPGFVEMGYPLICLGGLSFLGGIAKPQKKAMNLLKVKPKVNLCISVQRRSERYYPRNSRFYLSGGSNP